jgi:hypothetical protein
MQHEKQKYRKAANSVGACPVFRKLLKPDTMILGGAAPFSGDAKKVRHL